MANSLNKVTTKSILDATIATADIADDAVTADKLANAINTDIAAKAVLTGSTDNTITTVTGANAIQGEANLIFDGSSLGIGCTPSRELHVKGLDGTIRLESTAATGRTWIEFFDTSAIKGSIGYPSSGNDNLAIQQTENADMYFTTNDTERLRIDTNGQIVLSNGSMSTAYGNSICGGTDLELDTTGVIKFRTHTNQKASITDDGLCFGSDSAAVNALSDYETGSWTPTLPGGGNMGIYNASYTKIGRMVSWWAYIYPQSVPDNTTAFTIGGFPFTSNSTSNMGGSAVCGYSGSLDTDEFGYFKNTGDAVMSLYFIGGGNVGGTIQNQHITGATRYFALSGTYYTA